MNPADTATATLTQVPPSATLSPAQTFTPTPIPSLTPLPTLNAQDTQNLLNDLLENNGGCRLPCFWGITPGKTTFEEAKRFLETFTIFSIREISEEIRVIAPLIPFPQEMGTIRHSYAFKHGVVHRIRAYNGKLAPAYYLSNLLADYGPPDEMFIRTFREDEDGSQPYQIDVFYKSIGVFEYSGGDPEPVGDQLQNCFKDMYSPFIYLWARDDPMTSMEAIDMFLKNDSMPDPIPLKDATGTDVITFYDAFMKKNRENLVCLETPLELWP